jgi:hypothetical protein
MALIQYRPRRHFLYGVAALTRTRNIVRCLFPIRVLKPAQDGCKMGPYLRLHG